MDALVIAPKLQFVWWRELGRHSKLRHSIGKRIMRRLRWSTVLLWLVLTSLTPSLAHGQDKSVNPGINDSFADPDVDAFSKRFEVESREVYARRQAIIAACDVQPGQTVADIGAGTGLFTRLFSEAVGPEGRVVAVDISQKFLDHIRDASRQANQKNIDTQLAATDSTRLPANSVDLAFICDTYHHFEFPLKTMASIVTALRPGGRLVLIDFRRIEGVSSDWTLSHVRAGQEVFESEILQSGLRKRGEKPDLLKENYFVVFEKPAGQAGAAGAGGAAEGKRELLFPIIQKYGGVVARPNAAQPPRAGAKVVFDSTAKSQAGEVNKGLDRVARLLNLYGTVGLSARDVSITIVLHGDATRSVLTDAAYKAHSDSDASASAAAPKAAEAEASNPNLPLIRLLQKAGVEVMVCGQALNYKGYADSEVAEDIPIASAALTVIVNRQADGYSYLPIH